MLKWLRGLLVLFAVSLFLLTGSPATQAAGVVSQGHIFPLMGRTKASQQDDLAYQGGPVAGGVLNLYLVFLQPTDGGSTPTSTAVQDLLVRFSKDIGTSSLYKMLSQYTDKSGASPSSVQYQQTFIVPKTHPADHVYSDTDLQAIVSKLQKDQNIPADLQHVFAIFGEQGDKICTEASGKQYCNNKDFCAYHNVFGSPTAPSLYAVMGYPEMSGCQVKESPNQNLVADSDIDTLSHEIWEVATDPIVKNGYLAWVDGSGQEIADKCTSYGTSFPNTGGDVNWNGHIYEIQSEWDNSTHSCVLQQSS